MGRLGVGDPGSRCDNVINKVDFPLNSIRNYSVRVEEGATKVD